MQFDIRIFAAQRGKLGLGLLHPVFTEAFLACAQHGSHIAFRLGLAHGYKFNRLWIAVGSMGDGGNPGIYGFEAGQIIVQSHSDIICLIFIDISIIIYIIIQETAMLTIRLTTLGTSTGAIIPVEMLNKMKVQKGDVLFVTETPSGYLLTPYDPAIEEQIKLGRKFISEYRDTFKALSK